MLAYTGPELVYSGPAGTGKTRGGLEKLDAFCRWFPGCRALIARKTRASLTQTTLVCFEQEVLAGRFSEKPSRRFVYFHGGDMEYRYPNGSVAVIGGLDKATKIMSAQYDLALLDEATETDENDFEMVGTRLRNGKASFSQLLALCNPDSPVHYLKKREEAGKLRMIKAAHQDNPLLYNYGGKPDGVPADGPKTWTKAGRDYVLGRLHNLTGTRKQRLLYGIWCTAEGMVFDGFDRDIHLFNGWNADGTLHNTDLTGRYDGSAHNYNTEPPKDWPRSLSIDFGFSNPFVCHFWAEDGDGRLYLYREIYFSRRTVEEHAKEIIELCERFKEPAFSEIITDHDAEDRATLENHLRRNWRFEKLTTKPAEKGVESGCDMVRTRLKKQADGRPRVYFRRDALVKKDPELEILHKPTSTIEEVWGYVYDPKTGKPVKLNDHGCDATRYRIATVDLRPTSNFVRTSFRR